MELRLITEPELTVAIVFGAIDDAARDTFNRHLHPLAARRNGRILIDLKEATRITSNGLGALVSLVAWANAHGTQVVLAAPTPHVHSVICVTRLDRFLEISPTEEDARQRLLTANPEPPTA